MKKDIKKKRKYARRFYVFAVLSIFFFVQTLCSLTEVLRYVDVPTDSQRIMFVFFFVSTSLFVLQTILALKGYSEISKVILIKKKLKKTELYNKDLSEDYEQVLTMVEDSLFESGMNYLVK